jgi:hypothetical protein
MYWVAFYILYSNYYILKYSYYILKYTYQYTRKKKPRREDIEDDWVYVSDGNHPVILSELS